MKYKLNSFILLLFTSLLFTCDNYEFPASEYPKVETLEVVDDLNAGPTFYGKIAYLGKKQIINHGFVWFEYPPGYYSAPEDNAKGKIELGAVANLGFFEASQVPGIIAGETLYVKSFISTESYSVYGDLVKFTSEGPAPRILTAFPNTGTAGDTILLTGHYFSPVISDNKIEFAGVKSQVVKISDSTIHCIVPSDMTSEKSIPISISISGNKTEFPGDFILSTPVINDFSPPTGAIGAEVMISGENFSLLKEQNIVRFGNSDAANVVLASKNLLKVRVPTSLTHPENEISVTINGQTGRSESNFNVLPHVVNSITPEEGFVGSLVRIGGSGYILSTIRNDVFFENNKAKMGTISTSFLDVFAPEGIYTQRSFPIQVVVLGVSAYSQQNFTLKNAWIRKNDLARGYGAISFASNGFGFAGLGGENGDDKFKKFDPLENLWSDAAPYPGGRRMYASSFVIDGIGYVGLGGVDNGGNFALRKDFWSYDSQTNAWQKIADCPVESLYSIGFSRNGRGYIITGEQSNNFWEYDPTTDSWSQKEELLLVGNYYPDAGFVVNDKLYVTVADINSVSSKFWEYDFSSSFWSEKSAVPAADYKLDTRPKAIGFAISATGYIRVGSTLYMYNPSNDSWNISNHQISLNITAPIAFVIDGRVYYGTGKNSSQIWEYDPAYE